MKQKGCGIFLRQLELMNADGKVNWLDDKRYLELANEFQVPEDLRNAFTAYVREYVEDVGESTRTDGVFFNESVNDGIYDKLYYFYRPLVDALEESFPGLQIQLYIEPNCEDVSALLIVVKSVKLRRFVLPFVVYDKCLEVYNPFFRQFEPHAVYEHLGAMYEKAAEKVRLGMSLISLEVEKVPPSWVCPYCGEEIVDNILAPDEDNFCFCFRCRRYYYVGV